MTKRKPLNCQDLRDLFDYDEETGQLIRRKTMNYRAIAGRPAGWSEQSNGNRGRVGIYGKKYHRARVIWC